MNTSEVKSDLDRLGQQIQSNQQTKASLKSQLGSLIGQLDGLPSAYATLITTVNGYTPTGTFESLSKDELDKFTTEFQALKTAAQTAYDAL